MSDEGFLYVAYGNKYIEEAKRSIISLRRFSRKPIVVYSDRHEAFNRVAPGVSSWPLPPTTSDVKANPKLLKMVCLERTPFSRTIFLDTDTLFARDPSSLFQCCSSYSVCAAHAPVREVLHQPDIPSWFPELNTGVIVFNAKAVAHGLFEKWKIEMKRLEVKRDQPAFRRALFKSKDRLRFLVLPPEFNLRTEMPWFVGGNSKTIVLHGRNAAAERMALKGLAPRWPVVRIPIGWWRRELKEIISRLGTGVKR